MVGCQDSAMSQDIATECSLSTLAGGYTWHENAFVLVDFDGALIPIPATAVGREINDGAGNVTGAYKGNNPEGVVAFEYTGVVTVEPSCMGTYRITHSDGSSGGGGTIYIDPVSGNFTLLDEFSIGIANFHHDTP